MTNTIERKIPICECCGEPIDVDTEVENLEQTRRCIKTELNKLDAEITEAKAHQKSVRGLRAKSGPSS